MSVDLIATPPGAGGVREWRLRWKLRRNDWLGSRWFHRLAARVPLVRRVAARDSRALFDLCAGFVYSQVLLACVDSGLLRALRGSALTLDDIARRCGMTDDAMLRLLDAAESLRLVERAGGDCWVAGRLGAALGALESLEPMIRHHRLLYDDLRDPLALLRGDGPTSLGRFWAYASGDRVTPARVAEYSALMAASQEFIAEDVIDAYSFAAHRRLLDVGGGEGAFLEAVGHRVPGLALGLFDLPAVAERARSRFSSGSPESRVVIHEGDFRMDSLPGGHDLVTLVRVLHDHDEPVALELLRSVHAALPAGGVCLVAEPMAGQRGAEAMAGAYFGMYLLAMGQGRPRTPSAIAGLARRAGFRAARQLATRRPLLVSVVVLER